MRRWLAALAAVGVLAGLAPPLAAAAEERTAPAESFRLDKRRIDSALAKMVADGRVVGAVALVWRDGREIYYGQAGLADREAAKPMRRDTLFQIFSMTKPVTGVALMQLWEQGKFRLDDPVAKYLPEFADVRVYAGEASNAEIKTRPPDRPILIRDLVRHTAGFSYGMRDTVSDRIFKADNPLAPFNTLPQMGAKLARVPLMFEPGREWSYSTAVDVQAELVEKLSGQPFEAYAKAHIFEPLRMTDTAWTQPPERLPRLAATYEADGPGKLKRQDDRQTQMLNFNPARRLTMGGAGLASTLDDYMRFARMLVNGGTLDGVRVLKASTVRLMATDQLDPAITQRIWLPGKGQVGFGVDVAVRRARPATAAENRGAVGEFFWDGAASTLFWVDPANRLTAVFLTEKVPFDGTLHHDFREAVYGPGYLGPPGDEAP